MAVVFSLISQWATQISGIVVSVIILVVMITISILFDAVGVSVTYCKIVDIDKYCKKGNCKTINTAYYMLLNAEKVNNICNDVAGDLCGILSGAFGVSIIMNLCDNDTYMFFYSVGLSSLVAALTVGGKAFMKKIALTHCEKFVITASKIVSWFIPNKRTNGKIKKYGNIKKCRISKGHKKLR